MKKKNLRKLNKKEKKSLPFILPEETKKWILGATMTLLAIIVTLSFFELSGVAGKFLMAGLTFLIGKVVFAIPLVLVLAGLIFFTTPPDVEIARERIWPAILAILILILGISGTLECLKPDGKGGGLMGYLISWPFLKFFGFWVSQIIFGTAIIIGSVLFWQLLFPYCFLTKAEKEKIEKEKPLIVRLVKRVVGGPKLKIKEIEPDLVKAAKESKPPISAPELKTKEIEAKPLTFAYQPPPLDLLEVEKEVPTAGDIGTNSAIIKKTLQNFDIPVEMAGINIGPTVTQYTLKPAEGVKLSKITALSNDLSLALASHPIRIEAPIPGKSLVGIEVPNRIRAQVRLKDLIQNSSFQKSAANLMIVLGRDVSGNPVYADLARMPHLLVAGSTGSGKTIFLNNLIISLLYQPPTNNNPFGGGPEILRFVLVDPKRVEFPVYNDLPHLLCPVIYDANQTCNALKWLTLEMERRFDVLAAAKARDITTYNNQLLAFGEKSVMPYIVLIIDELADLMAAKGREVEAGIVRLAQMARAVGIHLVVATQRPSVEVITGLIKANITSRITFQVASQVDSRTVLDMAGAEKLLGSGDLLFVSAEVSKPKRIQGAYISEKEVRKVASWIKLKVKTPQEVPSTLVPSLGEGVSEFPRGEGGEFLTELAYGEEDPLYEDAKRVVSEAKKASASLLQRRLRVGYARAARLIDVLEERGVVGPADGARAREVYLENSEENIKENNAENNERQNKNETLTD